MDSTVVERLVQDSTVMERLVHGLDCNGEDERILLTSYVP